MPEFACNSLLILVSEKMTRESSIHRFRKGFIPKERCIHARCEHPMKQESENGIEDGR